MVHDKGYTNIKWYIVGYGSDEELYKRLIKENKLEDSFILLGKKKNPYQYMKKADLYAQPSRYEGKAVMITNYATSYSQVKDGVDGYITDLSIEGIAGGIEKLYKDEEYRKKLEVNCKNTNFTNKQELDKLYEIFNKGSKYAT